MKTGLRSRFQKLTRCIDAFMECEEAPVAVEYAIMLSLIVLLLVGATSQIGGKIAEVFQYFGEALQS